MRHQAPLLTLIGETVLDIQNFYIGGQWVSSLERQSLPLINPATETIVAKIRLAETSDVDQAVAAARAATASYSQSTKQQRLNLLQNIIDEYQLRYQDLAEAVSLEMGAPIRLAREAQVAAGLTHLRTYFRVLQDYEFSHQIGKTTIEKEAIGVCGLITPWNWPLNQLICKVAAALAAGCCVVLKPSELAPLSALIFTQIIHAAGVPAGVFNVVNGLGATVGAHIAGHQKVDMISFTGSTAAGISVAKAAAKSIKRVSQELGGKSANIILDDADFEMAVTAGVKKIFSNSGQSCNAPSRMLVPVERQAEVIEIACRCAKSIVVGDPMLATTDMGPVSNAGQYQKIQNFILTGMKQGARLVFGGTGKPDGLDKGYYVKPTIFSDVDPKHEIAQAEIFGPVLCIIPFSNNQHAIDIANDSEFGLSCYISSGSPDLARRIAKSIRAGMVHINNAPIDYFAPFGGYKKSGNGREWGHHGLEEFLETKAIMT